MNKTLYDIDKDVLVTHIIPNLQQPLLQKIEHLEKTFAKFVQNSDDYLCNMQTEYPYCGGKIAASYVCNCCNYWYCEEHIFLCKKCGIVTCDKCCGSVGRNCRNCKEPVCCECDLGQCVACNKYGCKLCRIKCVDCRNRVCGCYSVLEEMVKVMMCLECSPIRSCSIEGCDAQDAQFEGTQWHRHGTGVYCQACEEWTCNNHQNTNETNEEYFCTRCESVSETISE